MQNIKTLLPALTKEQVAAICPQAFASKPSKEVSERYVFVNTESIMDDMQALGWYPVSAKQRKPRAGVSTRFTPHMVIFQNPDLQITSEDEKLAPSIILLNSHDGTQAFGFRMGIYRLVCSNGLVIPEEEYTSFRIPHKGYTFDNLRKSMTKAVEMIGEKVEVINKMIQKDLSEQEQMDLALKALLIRSGVDSESVETPKYTQESLKEVLRPTREADKGDNLWVVFNRIQEAVTRGGFRVGVEGKKARPLNKIKSFQKDFKVNEELFEAALEVLN
jgi:hypothetical protein